VNTDVAVAVITLSRNATHGVVHIANVDVADVGATILNHPVELEVAMKLGILGSKLWKQASIVAVPLTPVDPLRRPMPTLNGVNV